MNKKVKKFVDAILDFDIVARSNIGFDEEKFQLACDSLQDLEAQFRTDGCVPLVVANVFVDMVPALNSAADRHDEETAFDIRAAAEEFARIAREITFSEA